LICLLVNLLTGLFITRIHQKNTLKIYLPHNAPQPHSTVMCAALTKDIYDEIRQQHLPNHVPQPHSTVMCAALTGGIHIPHAAA
jgi:hypothetical protein